MIHFNDGVVGILRVLAKLGITADSNSIYSWNKRQKARIYKMNRKKMGSVKHHHKQIQAIRNRLGDRDEEKKAKTYEQDNFSYLAI